jgi:D-alanyl-D-alanine carboxypeptidase/D-alanyl-D-alanine-endopeptidase (penicillin-binding protein 4)
MAPGERRRATSRAARVALLAAANLAAALLLLRALAGGPEASGQLSNGSPSSTFSAADPGEAPRSRRDATLERDLRAIVDEARAEATRLAGKGLEAAAVEVSVHVRELFPGGVEVDLDAGRPLRPASNVKLVTTAAALVLLGPSWHFDTAFEAGGPLRDGVLEGDLVVRAAGDPLYDPRAAGSVAALLEPAVAALRERGVRVVAGDLVLDEGSFAEPAPGPAWPDEGQRWAEYCAIAGGFSANRGCLTATVTPGKAGEPAAVRIAPRDHGLSEELRVTTAASGALVVAMQARAGGVLVRGTIPAGAAPFVDSFAHPDPVELFGRALSGALSRGGVLVEGALRRERGRPAGEVLAHLRTPLLDVLGPINTHSTNAVADQLFLALGNAVVGEGTREGGARATRLALERLGVSAEGLAQVDGSGLSRENRIGARQITALLAAVLALDETSSKAFRDSLAVAGESGTLEQRMRGQATRGRVRGKTGFIGGTSALSGVATARDGREWVFSILVNYPDVAGLNTRCWKPMQDRLCERLVAEIP